MDSKNIVCHVNRSACHVYVNSQLHFCGHFRVHFRTSTPTFICGRTATSLFYTYTRLWMYSGLYSAIAIFSQSFSCTFSYIHAYIHLWTHSNVSILHLHSPVPVAVQRSLQCYSYIFAAIFVYIFVHPCLHSSVDAQRRLYFTPPFICGCTAVSTALQPHFCGHFCVHFRTSTPTFICGRTCLSSLHSTLQRPITCLVFKVAKSAWLHFTHQTEISLFTTFFINI